MRITWYGHAAFLIETAGLRLILDPYKSPDSGGYEPIDEPADLVVVSHANDRYHSHLGQIVPPIEVLPALMIPAGGRTVRGIPFDVLRVYETPEKKLGDEVTVVLFESEGLKVVFLGDLGHPLSGEQVERVADADIVMVATGGPPTISVADLPPLLRAIDPKLVLPMHYKTPKINLNIRPVEEFLEAMAGVPVERPGRSWLEVVPDSLPGAMTVVVLDHAR